VGTRWRNVLGSLAIRVDHTRLDRDARPDAKPTIDIQISVHALK
jgi:hypothetical protein